MSRQQEVLDWATEMFGPVARNLDERGARLAEEAIEVAHTAGVPIEVIIKIAERIYTKPKGEMRSEIGGVALTLDAICALVGTNPDWEAMQEFDRVTHLPKEHWTSRHTAKVSGGTADLTPPR